MMSVSSDTNISKEFSCLDASKLKICVFVCTIEDRFNLVSKDSHVLNVHVVPHTHDDVGWLKTVEQYYYGLNNTIQHANVNAIISSVIRALQEDKDRTFTYVEMAFFSMWYNDQPDRVRKQVKKLVKSGQLTFVNGGW